MKFLKKMFPNKNEPLKLKNYKTGLYDELTPNERKDYESWLKMNKKLPFKMFNEPFKQKYVEHIDYFYKKNWIDRKRYQALRKYLE